MFCIYCGAGTKVVNSRYQKRLNQVWRRRKCLVCETVFTTEEAARYEAAWLVQVETGRLEPFSRSKLFISVYESCRHRKSALEDADALTETIIKKLLSQAQSGVIKRTIIAQTALVALNRFDNAASVHYAAFHS